MAKKNILVDIDFNQNQLLNPVLQNLPEDPSTGVEGQKYFNTTNHIERSYRNGAWQNSSDEYELPAASTNTRGGIKVGSRLYIENEDVLNVHRASKVIEGIGRFATDAEVEAGTQPNVAIDPVQLKSVIDSLPTPIQSDWNQTNNTALDYIKNKPDVASLEDDVEDLQEDVEELQNGYFIAGWRTPTADEWNYIINTRSASTVSGVVNARYAKAQINGVAGLILLPNVFELPSGITMTNINSTGAAFSDNTYTTVEWESLEDAGCVFMPVTGWRWHASVFELTKGWYWLSTSEGADTAYIMSFYDINVPTGMGNIAIGGSVRLLRENDTGGAFSLSASTKGDIAKSNLQFHCLNKEWRFAPNAYDVIGSDNANIAENYNGYIDLFGFGTSGWNSGAVCYQPWSVSTTPTDYIGHSLTGDYQKADWGYNIKKQLHKVAFTGDFNDLENVPLGEANGIAQLDNNGKVPSSQLPSYVDDVIEGYLYNNHFYEDSAHTILSPADQESGKIFVDLQDNLSYRWSGSTYVEVSQSLALGETSSTAYRGDRGKTAYDHATDPNKVTTAQSSGLYKIAVTSEGHVASATPVVASDIPTQDATETQKGVAELATSAEAITGTDTERIMTPKTVKDAHDSRHWFGTQAEFDALSPNYDANVIYHVEQGYTIPQPTVADAGKLLSVSALGDYELITIVNSELVEY